MEWEDSSQVNQRTLDEWEIKFSAKRGRDSKGLKDLLRDFLANTAMIQIQKGNFPGTLRLSFDL